jgi:hypothetical protein
MNNDLPPHLLTFPRSASHYFDRLIYDKIGFHIERSHTVNHLFDKNNNKTRRILTIVRDPIESISSLIALEKSLVPNSNRTNEIVSEYILLYNFLYENADYVIDYQDLVKYPDLVVDSVLRLLEINKENFSNFITNVDYNSKNFVESSKSLPGYEEVKLNSHNIELCYFYYKKILEKKITL